MKTQNTINEDIVRTIIVDKISNIPFATGPTGPSTTQSIIDENGKLSKTIYPLTTNTYDIGNNNFSLQKIYSNIYHIDGLPVDLWTDYLHY